MKNVEIHSCPELMDYIQEVGFLPLLDSGIRGYSAGAGRCSQHQSRYWAAICADASARPRSRSTA